MAEALEQDPAHHPRPSFGVVIPFYNEANYLPRTLASLREQSRLPDQVVLVDNASTDEGPRLARQWCEQAPMPATLLDEPRAGKVFALQTGCKAIEQQWVVTCDADTYYPPHYLQTAERLAQAEREAHASAVVALLALPLPAATELRAQVVADRLALARHYPNKCFTGGFGQVFRADVLRQVGGFDPEIWPYVLMDHEIVHRVLQHGACCYDADFWCVPDERRSDRGKVRWKLVDRWLYRNVPRVFQDWFFYSYLAKRFARRKMLHLNLREQAWQKPHVNRG